jgi:hypothetical protein
VDVELFRRPKFDQEVETKGKGRGSLLAARRKERGG